MKYNVCVVTGTRAEYGLLRPLLFRLKESRKVNLTLLVTGSHLSASFGNTQNEIIEDGFVDSIKINIPLEDDSKKGMAYATGIGLEKFSIFLGEHKTDLLVILGDRYEILSAAIAAYLIGIPIAHISGGDVTEGGVDDGIRHCITKLSMLHFPGCEDSRKRIIQMGENPKRVFNVGELGVENCLKETLLTKEMLAEQLSFPEICAKYCVVTYHPVTMEENTAVRQVRELIKALDCFPNMGYIVTMANADAGGRAINQIWMQEKERHNNWFVTYSLGVVKYLSALKYCQAVIGNSSSGVVEAPSMKIPTINIGDRQKGRMMAESVICCSPVKAEITHAMGKALSKEFKEKSREWISPFGIGNTSERIMEILIDYLETKEESNEKPFYNIDFKEKIGE